MRVSAPEFIDHIVTKEKVEFLWASVTAQDVSAIKEYMVKHPDSECFEVPSNPSLSVVKVTHGAKSKWFILFDKVIGRGTFSEVLYTAPLSLRAETAIPQQVNPNQLNSAKKETYCFEDLPEIRECFQLKTTAEIIQALYFKRACTKGLQFSKYYGQKLNEAELLAVLQPESYCGSLVLVDRVNLTLTRIDITALYIGEDLAETAIKAGERKYTAAQRFKIIVNLIKDYEERFSKKGYLHRDLKTENAILLNDLTVKLIDIAFAAKVGTIDNIHCCSLPNAAPEVIYFSSHTLDSEIYALIVMIIEISGWFALDIEEKEDGTQEIQYNYNNTVKFIIDERFRAEAAENLDSMRDLINRGLSEHPAERPLLAELKTFFEQLQKKYEAKQTLTATSPIFSRPRSKSQEDLPRKISRSRSKSQEDLPRKNSWDLK